MKLARAIINSTNRASKILRDARTHVDIEDAASIEHVCAMLNPREQTNAWQARILMRRALGKEGTTMPVVPDHAAQLMDATMAAMALPKRGAKS